MENKVCIITGGAKGIGKAISRCLVLNGYRIVIFDIDLKAAIESKNEIEKECKIKNSIEIFEGSAANSSDVKKMVDMSLKKFNRIDALVNNAGLYGIGSIFDESEETWEKFLNINLKGTFLCCKVVLDYMKDKRCGKIVNISSISGKKQSIFACPSYCASKAGVIGLTRCIAAQVAKYNINVNCIAPSAVETELLFKNLTEDQLLKVKETIPLGRFGKPEDIAGAVKFLLSEESDFITGETINVNGGSFME